MFRVIGLRAQWSTSEESVVDHQSFVFHPSVASTVRFKARKFVYSRSDHTSADIPDIQQGMYMHLLVKCHLFNPARGSEGTFASKVLDRWIAQYLRDQGRIKRGSLHRTTPFSQIDLPNPLKGASFGEQLTTSDGDLRQWRSTPSAFERVDQIEAIAVALGRLTPYQTVLLEDIVKHSVSYAARQRGVTRSQIKDEIASIQRIFNKCGVCSKSAYNA